MKKSAVHNESIDLGSRSRNANIDLIKWVAMTTMVCDHMSHIFQSYENVCITIGRISFPLFCLCIAINSARPLKSHDSVRIGSQIPTVKLNENIFWTDTTKSYFFKMFIFSLLSEIPMRILNPESTTLSIFPTLMLGLALCLMIEKPIKYKFIYIFALLLFSFLCNEIIMYGFLGVLLPASFYFALNKGYKYLWVVMLLSVLCTMQYYLVYLQYPFEFYSRAFFQQGIVFIALSCLLAPVIGIYLLNMNLKFNPYPVTAWGYWFYPVQYLLISALRYLIRLV